MDQFFLENDGEDCDKQLEIEASIQKNFIRKVLLIVLAQLLFSFFFALFFIYSPGLLRWQLTHTLFFYICMIGTVVVQIVLFCCDYTRKVPHNYIMLAIFTFCESYVLSFIVSSYYVSFGSGIILAALGLTAVLVLILFFIAQSQSIDITGQGAYLSMAGMGLVFLGLLSFFWSGLQLLVSVISIVLFGLFLVYDIQLLMGKKSNKYETDEYVAAAVMIYTDVVMLFMELLQLLGQLNSNNQ